jgi:hypothetical protein
VTGLALGDAARDANLAARRLARVGSRSRAVPIVEEVLMPPARKSARSSSTRAAFKEPAALKRLNTSLDAAHKALGELRTHAGRDVAQSTRDLHKDLRTFVSSAQRHTGKLAKALQREFEQAQKRLSNSPATRSRTTATSSRKRKPQTAAGRSTRKAS